MGRDLGRGGARRGVDADQPVVLHLLEGAEDICIRSTSRFWPVDSRRSRASRRSSLSILPRESRPVRGPGNATVVLIGVDRPDSADDPENHDRLPCSDGLEEAGADLDLRRLLEVLLDRALVGRADHGLAVLLGEVLGKLDIDLEALDHPGVAVDHLALLDADALGRDTPPPAELGDVESRAQVPMEARNRSNGAGNDPSWAVEMVFPL